MNDRFSAFRHSSYRRYFLSRFMTSLAAQVVSVAVAWQMYDVTQNAALLGWIGLVQFLPALLLVVVTGVASDRLGRRNVMGASVSVELVCAGVILALALTGRFDPLIVLATLTVFGVARAFYTPASSSLAVNLVPRETSPMLWAGLHHPGRRRRSSDQWQVDCYMVSGRGLRMERLSACLPYRPS